MGALTSDLMIKALDALSVRQVVTANNIANASTTGFRPSRVTFEAALVDAARQGPSAVRALRPKVETDAAGDLRLDLELSNASSTAARYAAVLEVLNRRLQIDALALSRNN